MSKVANKEGPAWQAPFQKAWRTGVKGNPFLGEQPKQATLQGMWQMHTEFISLRSYARNTLNFTEERLTSRISDLEAKFVQPI